MPVSLPARRGRPLIEQDRARMVEIKAKIRGIRAVERQIEVDAPQDRSAGIVGTYALAVRQGLRFRSRAPFQLGGVRLYALLDELTRSIQRCLKRGAMNVSPNYSASSSQCEMNWVCFISVETAFMAGKKATEIRLFQRGFQLI